jgi:hypothetical protein
VPVRRIQVLQSFEIMRRQAIEAGAGLFAD